MGFEKLEEKKNGVFDMPEKTLRKRYIFGLASVALFVCLFALIVGMMIREQERDSRLINIAGRQRMLSQKLTKIALVVRGLGDTGDTAQHLKEMSVVLDMWTQSHMALQQGCAKMGLPATLDPGIIAQFKSIEPNYMAMSRASKNIIHAFALADEGSVNLDDLNNNVDVIMSAESIFLKGMNDIVYSYDKKAQAKVLLLQRTQWILTTLILAVLATLAVFVFEPAVRLIRSQFKKLSMFALERSDLVNELEEALATVKQLEGFLPICASCKKIRDTEDKWTQIEVFIEEHSEAEFSHGICPDCVKELYPETHRGE